MKFVILMCLIFKNLFIYFQHIRRQFHDQNGNITKADSGLWFITLDYSGLKGIQKEMPEYLKDIQPLKCEGPYCGWPYLYPFMWIIDFRLVHFSQQFMCNIKIPPLKNIRKQTLLLLKV